MKIGIFGGSFNPPHNGHLRLANETAKLMGFDKMLIIPSCIPPHKSASSYAPAEDRIEMCRLAFDSPEFEVSDFEIKKGGKSYTFDTLRELKKTYPDDELYFIIGSDMFATFTQWYRWEEILEMCTVVASSRKADFEPDFSPYSELQRKKIIFTDITPLELSSTQLRSSIKSNFNCSDFVRENVLEYIREHNLYDDEFDEYRELMAKMEKPSRFYHSECVSESAGELALLYGADVRKAKLAGLLHDITKNMPDEEQLALLDDITPLERGNQKVWHQMTAPVFLRKNGIIDDEEILSAIRWHTTGRANMTLLEKIVYTADFISAERDYPDVETVRKLATISLEHAILYTSRYTVKYLVANDKPIHPATLDCYNDMLLHFGL